MSKLVIIPNNLDALKDINDYILLGIENYSVNTLNVTLGYLDKLKGKKLFISLNKNLINKDLLEIEKILIKLNDYNIEGLLYSDIGLLNIANRLDLNYQLFWSNEHLTTNYHTINYWYEHGVDGTFISNEITFEEMLEISEHTSSKLMVQLFGYIPMYVSKRHAVKNYLKHFKLETNSKNFYIYKENKKYSIIDNKEGTIIYTDFILNGIEEYRSHKETFAYILINGYNIETDKLLKVIDIFKGVDIDINTLFSNLSKGFLHEETIFRVKKNDK